MCKTVHYMKCPNMSLEKSHMAPLYACTEQTYKTFRDTDRAITFWFECSKPISSLEDIMQTIKDTQKRRDIEQPINLKDIQVEE